MEIKDQNSEAMIYCNIGICCDKLGRHKDAGCPACEAITCSEACSACLPELLWSTLQYTGIRSTLIQVGPFGLSPTRSSSIGTRACGGCHACPLAESTASLCVCLRKSANKGQHDGLTNRSSPCSGGSARLGWAGNGKLQPGSSLH